MQVGEGVLSLLGNKSFCSRPRRFQNFAWNLRAKLIKLAENTAFQQLVYYFNSTFIITRDERLTS